MNIRKLAVASMLVAGTSLVPLYADARTDVEVVIAPPAPIHEVVPAPRHGYVWTPGYWDWNGKKHVWRKGDWARERHGQHWVAHNWEQRGDHWYSHSGHWETN